MIVQSETTRDVTRLRFTREQYHRMGEVGIIGPDDRVELLDGEVVVMSPIGPLHGAAVAYLNREFVRLAGDEALLFPQNPVALSEWSEPQPDLMLLRPRDDFYQTGHARPEDVLLLVEVADTSASRDRGVKLRLYAEAGIAEYWVVDLGRREIIVYQDPRDGEYRETRHCAATEAVAPAALPNCPVRLVGLLK